MTSYTVDDVDAATGNLNDLLDVMCEIQFQQYAGVHDRRLNSLLWIARDLCEGIVAKSEENNEAKRREKCAC